MSGEMSIPEFRDAMMKLAQNKIPKQSKTFLKTETQKLRRRVQSYANQTVPVSEVKENLERGGMKPRHLKYHKSFKVGKTYKYEDSFAKRVYNASGHGKYVESGRPVIEGYRRSEKWGQYTFNGNYGNSQNPKYKSKANPTRDRRYGVTRRSKQYDVFWTIKKQFKPIYDQDCLDWIERMVKEGRL